MKQDCFTKLPSEIIINILSGLPVRTIISCKCVCKSLLKLVETREFAESHLSKSTPGLVILRTEVIAQDIFRLFKVYEFNEVLNLERHELHYDLVTKFNFPCHGWIYGSTNGLLFLCDLTLDGLYICNPITRDYIKLHCPREFVPSYHYVVYGFGMSKMTNQHKLVRIFYDSVYNGKPHELGSVSKSECQVYTLGTRSWRRIGPSSQCRYGGYAIGVFVNGNLHWLVYDLKGSLVISCFDLETEIFSTFSLPPFSTRSKSFLCLSTLSDCLCLSDNSSNYDIVIWLMKKYGDEESWMKEYVISKGFRYDREHSEIVRPIKVFKDGDILLAWHDYCFFYYSNKSKTIMRVDLFSLHTAGFVTAVDSILHASSFLSLKNFTLENVVSF